MRSCSPAGACRDQGTDCRRARRATSRARRARTPLPRCGAPPPQAIPRNLLPACEFSPARPRSPLPPILLAATLALVAAPAAHARVLAVATGTPTAVLTDIPSNNVVGRLALGGPTR